jgi:hypothetical protein
MQTIVRTSLPSTVEVNPPVMTLPATIIGLGVSLEILAITAVCLRFWCKHILKRKLLLHDVFIVLGLVGGVTKVATLS